ncbi:MAG: ATPase [Acidobacteria bacterium]|nr:ATPase [Acidobacteriota bacterium]
MGGPTPGDGPGLGRRAHGSGKSPRGRAGWPEGWRPPVTRGPGIPPGPLGLGLDAGGTETRWALAGAGGDIVAEGRAEGFSATELGGPGAERITALLGELGREVRRAGQPSQVHAGITGLGEGEGVLVEVLAGAMGLPPGAVSLGSDIETAFRHLFEPGQGYMVYAGTGSVAAFLDGEGTLHRAGGRGNLLDDGGGGFWIAREALRRIWRTEDERPGAWRESPLAAELFAMIGGSDWSHSRRAVYGGRRGDVGRLALAVARAAEADPAAREILAAAGEELARLARALIARYGPRPVALSGRAATLHPGIAEAMARGLPPGPPFSVRPCQPHHAAARMALRRALACP